MDDSLIVIVETGITLFLCIGYYYLFGRVKASKRVRVTEVMALLITIMSFGLVKNVKIWAIFIAFFLIGMLKKIVSKNERTRKGHNY